MSEDITKWWYLGIPVGGWIAVLSGAGSIDFAAGATFAAAVCYGIKLGTEKGAGPSLKRSAPNAHKPGE